MCVFNIIDKASDPNHDELDIWKGSSKSNDDLTDGVVAAPGDVATAAGVTAAPGVVGPLIIGAKAAYAFFACSAKSSLTRVFQNS